MTNKLIFFDHASTTPVDPEVLEAMLPFLKGEFGNPSSHIHSLGQGALRAMDESRVAVASLINAKAEEIIFTSGATESNNLAIKGITGANHKPEGKILISQIEHYSVLNPVKTLEKQGYKVEKIPVDKYGIILTDKLREMLSPDTLLVCVMAANTEIGSIQPVAEAVEIVKSYNPAIFFHCDAASAAGWIPVDVIALGLTPLLSPLTIFTDLKA